MSLLIFGCNESCPPGMVYLEGGLTLVGGSSNYMLKKEQVEVNAVCMDKYEYPNRAGELPRIDVTYQEAKQLCESEGKRLCSDLEWARACRGFEGRKYSYGNLYDSNICNTPIKGAGPLPGKPIPFSRSGQFENCSTPEGVFDLNGNVSEWVEGIWDGPKIAPGNTETEWHICRGGTMWSETFYGQDCLSRHGHPTGSFGADDGFRCCKDPI